MRLMAAARSSLDLLASTRPSFPEGLQVLLVEQGTDECTVQQLTDLQYAVTRVDCIQDALITLSSSTADVVLADVAIVGDLAGQDAKSLFTAAGRVPVVLMGTQCSPEQVLAAVEHGAADFLEKPLLQLKLRNIWQHTVRMMMNACDTMGRPASPKAAAEPAADLMARHDAAADAAAASAAAFAISAAEALVQEQQQQLDISVAGVIDEPCRADRDECLKELALPSLMPSQLNMDPDMLFMDLGAPVQTDVPNIDDILQPFSPANPAVADGSTEQMLPNSSEEQPGSGTTGMTAFPGELESCADTSSRMGGVASPLGSRVGAALQPHHSMWPPAGYDQQYAASAARNHSPAAAAAGACPPPQQQLPAPGCPLYPAMPMSSWGPFWGAPTGARGMVWGMPVYSVARAPGLPVPCRKGSRNCSTGVGSSSGSAAASAASSPTCKAATAKAPAGAAGAGVPPCMMQSPMCWPMMPMMGMNGAAAPAGLAAAGPMCMFPGAGMYPGMFPGMMGPMGVPMMGLQGYPFSPMFGAAAGAQAMGMPGQWPAAAAGAQQQPSAAGTALTAPIKQQQHAVPAPAGPTTAALGMYRSGDLGSSGLGSSLAAGSSSMAAGDSSCAGGDSSLGVTDAGDEFISELFVDDKQLANDVFGEANAVCAGGMGPLNTDSLFSNFR